MKIHDCFTYFGEDDLLELRLRTLDGHVDRFVIAEATRTFTGKDKPLRFDPARYARWADRITYVVVDDLDAMPASPWDNETRQRNALLRGLADAAAADWVLLSDVDEIPRPQALRDFRPGRYLSAVLSQRLFYYAFNNEVVRSTDARELPWRKARLTTVERLHHWFESVQSMRNYKVGGALRSVRRVWNTLRTQQIGDGGWHFSYLMTPEQILEKIRAYSHQEFNLPQYANVEYIRDSIRQRRAMFGDQREFRLVPLDQSFPQPLRDDPAAYRRWLL